MEDDVGKQTQANREDRLLAGNGDEATEKINHNCKPFRKRRGTNDIPRATRGLMPLEAAPFRTPCFCGVSLFWDGVVR